MRQVTLRSATFRGSLRARAGIRKQIDVCDWTNDNWYDSLIARQKCGRGDKFSKERQNWSFVRGFGCPSTLLEAFCSQKVSVPWRISLSKPRSKFLIARSLSLGLQLTPRESSLVRSKKRVAVFVRFVSLCLRVFFLFLCLFVNLISFFYLQGARQS